MKITNTTKSDIGLQPELIVPAKGSIDLDAKTAEGLRNLPSLEAHFSAGRLVADGAEGAGNDVSKIPETPEDIDAIEDKDVLGELLDAHGVEYDGRMGVEKRRDLLKSIMFVGE